MAISLIYLVVIYMEWDRVLGFKFWSYERFAKNYMAKPLAHPTRRVVILYVDPSESTEIPSDMFKSILDQSVKVTDIAVQTVAPKKFKHMKNFVSTHVPRTELISEGDAGTILIYVEPKIYPYDFVEQTVVTYVGEEVIDESDPEIVLKDSKENMDQLKTVFRRLTPMH